jgi:hypothetical protein
MAQSTPVVREPEFGFRFEVNGFNPWLISEFNWEGETVGISEHAGGGMNVAKPQSTGFTKYGKLVLKMCRPIEGTDREYFDVWKAQASDPDTNTSGNPVDYERNCSIYSARPNKTISRVDEFKGAMVEEIKPGNRSSTATDKDYVYEVHLRFYTHSYRLV